MIDHEPSIYSATPVWGESAGIAAVDSRSEHLGRSVQTMSSYLAVGCGLQHQRRGSDCQSSLYKRPQMGQTLRIRGFGRIARSQTAWSSQSPWKRNRGAGNQDSHFSSCRLGPGIYHMVTGQVGKSFASTLWNFFYQPGDNSAYPFASWPSVLDRSDMVRKQRSRIRGKKNAIIQIYRHRPRRGQVICFDEMGPLQTIPRGGKAWGTDAPTFVRTVTNATAPCNGFVPLIRTPASPSEKDFPRNRLNVAVFSG